MMTVAGIEGKTISTQGSPSGDLSLGKAKNTHAKYSAYNNVASNVLNFRYGGVNLEREQPTYRQRDKFTSRLPIPIQKAKEIPIIINYTNTFRVISKSGVNVKFSPDENDAPCELWHIAEDQYDYTLLEKSWSALKTHAQFSILMKCRQEARADIGLRFRLESFGLAAWGRALAWRKADHRRAVLHFQKRRFRVWRTRFVQSVNCRQVIKTCKKVMRRNALLCWIFRTNKLKDLNSLATEWERRKRIQRAYSTVFSRWRWERHEKKYREELCRVAENQYRTSLTQATFLIWRKCILIAQNNRQKIDFVAQRHNKTVLRNWWYSLRSAFQTTQILERKWSFFSAQAQSKLKNTMFDHWIANWERRVNIRSNLLKFERLCFNRCAAHFFCTLKRHRVRAIHAFSIHYKRRLSSDFKIWKDRYQGRVLDREQRRNDVADSFFARRSLYQNVVIWRSSMCCKQIQYRQKYEAVRLHRKGTLQRLFSYWRSRKSDHLKLKRLFAKLESRQSVTLKRSWNAWRKILLNRHARRAAAQLAQQNYRLITLPVYFSCWQERFVVSLREKSKFSKASRHYSNALKVRILSGLLDIICVMRRKQLDANGLIQRARICCLARVLLQWRQVMARRSCIRLKLALAAAHHERHLLSSGLASWQKYILQKREFKLQVFNLARKVSVSHLRTRFALWNQKACEHLKVRRAIEKIRSGNQLRLMKVSLYDWVVKTRQFLNRKFELEQQAESLVLCSRQKKMHRFFGAWISCAIIHLQQRQKDDKAVTHHSTGLAVKSLLTWCHHARHSRWIRRQTQFADAFRLSSLMTRHFRCWHRKRPDWWLIHNRNVIEPLQFWSEQLLRKALAGWRKVCALHALHRRRIAESYGRQRTAVQIVQDAIAARRRDRDNQPRPDIFLAKKVLHKWRAFVQSRKDMRESSLPSHTTGTVDEMHGRKRRISPKRPSVFLDVNRSEFVQYPLVAESTHYSGLIDADPFDTEEAVKRTNVEVSDANSELSHVDVDLDEAAEVIKTHDSEVPMNFFRNTFVIPKDKHAKRRLLGQIQSIQSVLLEYRSLQARHAADLQNLQQLSPDSVVYGLSLQAVMRLQVVKRKLSDSFASFKE